MTRVLPPTQQEFLDHFSHSVPVNDEDENDEGQQSHQGISYSTQVMRVQLLYEVVT